MTLFTSLLRTTAAVGLTLLALVFTSSLAPARAQQLASSRLSLGLTNNIATLALQGRSNLLIRVDGSRDLQNWETEWLIRLSNSLITLTHTNTGPNRFWRSVELSTAPSPPVITAFTPSSGTPGAPIQINGTGFNPTPTRNRLFIGGAEATVISASSSRLSALVPTNAVTGEVTVTTPLGTASAPFPFTVTHTLAVEFVPPPGINPTHYHLVTPAVPGSRTSSANGSLSVRLDSPSLVMAIPVVAASARPAFLRLTTSNPTSLTINAQSTAEALVALHPLFASPDPFIASRVLRMIQTNSAVTALGSTLDRLAATATNLFEHPDVLTAYENAVIALGTNTTFRALARDLLARRPIARHTQPQSLGVYSLEDSNTRFVEVERENDRFSFQGYPFNPVDWLVLLEEIDVDQAFPNGRTDFNELHQKHFLQPALLPRRATPRQFALVGADFFFSRFGILGYLAKTITSTIGDAIFDKGLRLTGTNTLYAAYAFGPSFGPDSDRVFANTHFAEQRNAALVLNLAAAVLDAASALLDYGIFEDSQKRQELMTKLVTEATKSAPTIRTSEEFLQLTMDLTAFLLKEIASGAAEDGSKAAAEGALKTIGKTLTGVLKVLDIIGGVGQVAERASGLLRTTPIEESIIVLGNPFQLAVDAVEPQGAAPGDTLDLLIHGALFDRFDRHDAVYLETSTEEIPLPVLSATGDRTAQRVKVRIPDSTATLSTGVYTLSILADGRRGSAQFELVSSPTVRHLLPAVGYAVDPINSFFQPTRIQLVGFGFSPDDTFTFAGGARATEKLGVTGSVTLTVPPGARSGPIHIRRLSGAEADSPAFSVLGPPQITDFDPVSGPVGTRVHVRIRNLSENPSDSIFRWLGFAVSNPTLSQSSNDFRLAFTIPDSSRTGAFNVETPAGTDSRTFTVLPGRARGGSIRVGGDSPITLDQALAYAAGSASPPPDDGDVRTDPDTGVVVQLDPPYEHADFISGTIGAEFADTISVTDEVKGHFAISGSYDTITAMIDGSLTITGSNNIVDVRIQGAPQDGLTIFGDHNRLVVESSLNQRDGVRIDGGRFNRLEILSVSSNLAHGITLTGGAEGNLVMPGPRRASASFLTGIIRRNQGHGIALLSSASDNTLAADLILHANGEDGLHLNGPRVAENRVVSATTHTNTGNGITVAGGAARNSITGVSQGNGLAGLLIQGGGTDSTTASVRALNNQADGITILADPTGSPTNTSILTSLAANGRHGILIQGAVDPHGFILSDTISSNRFAGVRLDSGASGWTIRPRVISANATGVEMVGPNTRSNTLTSSISSSRGPGVRLLNAAYNLISKTTLDRNTNGIVLDHAHSNVLEVTATANAGAGLLLTNGAIANVISNSTFSFNTNGVILAAGSSSNLLTGLLIERNTDHGFILRDPLTDFNTLQSSTLNRPSLDAIRIELGASHNLIGSQTTTRTNTGVAISSQRLRAGVRISDPGTSDNLIQGVSVVTVASDTLNEAGIVIENGAGNTHVGAPDPDGLGSVYVARCRDGILVRNQATNTLVLNTFFWAIRNSGVNVDNASDVTIGDPGGIARNVFQQSTTGITLQNPNTTLTRVLGNLFLTNSVGILLTNIPASMTEIAQNDFIGQHNDGIRIVNTHGIRVSNNLLLRNSDGVELSAGSSDNLLLNNSIQEGSIGVRVSGANSLRNTIQGPGITSNALLGILLVSGGNRSLPAPIITDVTPNAVFGTANAPDRSRISLFSDSSDEGAVALGSSQVFDGKFRVPVALNLNAVGILFQLTATVTDPEGNTSPFGRLQTATPSASARIVFVSEHEGHTELALLQGSLATPTRLTTGPDNDSQPALSPRATNLVFVSNRSGLRALYSMPPLPGQTPQLLSPPTTVFEEYEPTWSPDGRRIAFVSERDGNPEIYLANPDGSAPTRLTTHPATDRWPVISPNGTQLAFLSNRSARWQLAFMNIDGSGLRLSELPASPVSRPAWSPDGSQIAFAVESSDDVDIFVTTPAAVQAVPLITTPGRNQDPVWIPDGSGLVFASDRSGQMQLYTFRTSSSTSRPLTLSSTPHHSPSLAAP